MKNTELDRTDLRILSALQDDGRLTNQKLAERVSLSPSACLSRLRHLEAAGFIEGYQARIALSRVRPIMVVYAEVSMKGHVLAVFEKFETIIADTPEIVEAARISGPFDYFLKVVVTDVQDWEELAVSMLSEANGVDKVVTYVVMQTVKPYTGTPISASASARRRLPQLRKLFPDASSA